MRLVEQVFRNVAAGNAGLTVKIFVIGEALLAGTTTHIKDGIPGLELDQVDHPGVNVTRAELRVYIDAGGQILGRFLEIDFHITSRVVIFAKYKCRKMGVKPAFNRSWAAFRRRVRPGCVYCQYGCSEGRVFEVPC